ncbi:MAG: PHP domain-containing protein [Acidimicrobiales bacterium]
MIDLHTHSTCSDGSETPERVAELAHEAGCHAFALTDHDTTEGLGRAARRAAKLGVEFVPGCEISCEFSPGSLHVLVYFVADGHGPLADELVRLRQDRLARNRQLVARLSGPSVGLDITEDDLAAEAGGDLSRAGRPHVATILMRRGVVKSIQEAFDTLLSKGRAGYVGKGRLGPAQVADLARQSGGLAVLAHPLSLGLDPPSLASAVAELASMGFAGIEATYGRYSTTERAGLADLAARNNLVATGGSDFHGQVKPDLAVGAGRGDLAVPTEALVALKRLLERRPG